MKTISDTIKSIIIIALVVLLGTLASMRLMKIQIVGGDDIVAPNRYASDALIFEREIVPTRGEILDYNGNVIIGNSSRTDIVLQKAFFPQDLQEGNRILLELYRALEKHGYVFDEELPITRDTPYVFTKDDVSEVVEDLNLNVYASAENCIDKLISDYKIADDYSDEEKRIIAGMRYQMIAKDFSYGIDLLLAKGVDPDTVIEIKELGNFCRGV